MTEVAYSWPKNGELDTPLPPIPVACSARHVHLTQETIEHLFGPGYQLTVQSPLSQPGQFAAQETVNLVGREGRIEHVRVLGPPRSTNQVEISRSDEHFLGLHAPLRLSGDLAHTPGVMLEGPCGFVVLHTGVICAQRHIHMSPADAARFGVRDYEMVAVSIDGRGRDLSFGDVRVRVAPNYRLELHLDTDEANAADVQPGDTCRLIRNPLHRTDELE